MAKLKPVEEHKASGDIERVFHEVKQVLRINGVGLNFRSWAFFENSFPVIWSALSTNASSHEFEEASDQIRFEAVARAARLGRVGAAAGVHLGESQRYQLRKAIELYHYANPKLLLFTSALKIGMSGGIVGKNPEERARSRKLRRGIPERMFPMEMAGEKPSEPEVQTVFRDIRQTFGIPSIHSDFRTFALWPQYLSEYWRLLKPIAQGPELQQHSQEIRELARKLVATLPYPVTIERAILSDRGEDVEDFIKLTERFEDQLPDMILSVCLAALDWESEIDLSRSPFPPERMAA